MPRIDYGSKESLISGATDTDAEYDEETVGGERYPYEQGQPLVSGAKKTPDLIVSFEREEFKVGKETFSITPQNKNAKHRIRYVKSDASIMGNNHIVAPFHERDVPHVPPCQVDDFDFDRISRDEITNINLDDSPGNQNLR